ncbi:hypothetical protein ANCDUO_14452 [Ancylostoma duodenale]|uniref:Tc1-like transposase DDE domain-containing protein n=1 Tax=Ancylostoma duodenale TaxID=51022 RepID=A0A0C2GED3_9BILA|nr:hypothetical protein ANCDUO_14452 [Ancylostoma duodenale]
MTPFKSVPLKKLMDKWKQSSIVKEDQHAVSVVDFLRFYSLRDRQKRVLGNTDNHLLSWATEHYENGHWILQQDGAPTHLAKSTQYWCLANLPEASEWSANSPELNVLDLSTWAMLGQKACQKKHTGIQALRKSLEKARNENPQDHVRAAVEVYPKRLKAAIRAKGGHIE